MSRKDCELNLRWCCVVTR